MSPFWDSAPAVQVHPTSSSAHTSNTSATELFPCYQSFPSSGIPLASGNSHLFRRPKMNIVSRSPRRRRDGCSECKRKKVRVSTSHRIVETPCADPNHPVRPRTACLFPVHALSQTMQIRVQIHPHQELSRQETSPPQIPAPRIPETGPQHRFDATRQSSRAAAAAAGPAAATHPAPVAAALVTDGPLPPPPLRHADRACPLPARAARLRAPPRRHRRAHAAPAARPARRGVQPPRPPRRRRRRAADDPRRARAHEPRGRGPGRGGGASGRDAEGRDGHDGHGAVHE